MSDEIYNMPMLPKVLHLRRKARKPCGSFLPLLQR